MLFQQRRALTLALMFVATGCQNTLFGGKSKEKKPEPPAVVETTTSTQAETPPPPAPEPVPEPQPYPEVVDLCQEFKGKNYKVLVLDFKSGWFAGDGGSFFQTFIETECQSTFKIHYLHITQKMVETNFKGDTELSQKLLPCLNGASSWRYETRQFDINAKCAFGNVDDYDQFWLLSGSIPENDSADIAINAPFFQSVLASMKSLASKKPKAGMFFGAGLSNINHANTALGHLLETGWATFEWNDPAKRGRFPKDTYPKTYPEHEPLKAGNGSQGTFDSALPAFAPVKSLFDWKAVARSGEVGKCFGDPIRTTTNYNFKLVARDHCDKPVIATLQNGERKVFLEGNLARFYGTKPADYLHRVILYLSR